MARSPGDDVARATNAPQARSATGETHEAEWRPGALAAGALLEAASVRPEPKGRAGGVRGDGSPPSERVPDLTSPPRFRRTICLPRVPWRRPEIGFSTSTSATWSGEGRDMRLIARSKPTR